MKRIICWIFGHKWKGRGKFVGGEPNHWVCRRCNAHTYTITPNPMPKKKTKMKAFKNLKHNCLHLNFPNGNSISTIWGVGSYTENHYLDLDIADSSGFAVRYETFMGSNNVEVMIDCPDRLLRSIQKKYNGGSDSSVIGYLSITQWIEILNKISK